MVLCEVNILLQHIFLAKTIHSWLVSLITKKNGFQGLPIMLIREHGIRGGYRNNLSSLYDLNCAIAYHERPERRFNTVANTFVPEQDFTADHGPGRNDLIGRKLAAWAEDKRITDGVDPATEYQCCFTSQNG